MSASTFSKKIEYMKIRRRFRESSGNKSAINPEADNAQIRAKK
jgi:hypothetical protein